MAKGGPIISAGPAIASPRGGVPLGIRIGAERIGSNAPVNARSFDTPRAASLRGFLKGFVPISRPDQIGFRTSPGLGGESVKSLDPLNIRIRGENQTRPVRPSVRLIEPAPIQSGPAPARIVPVDAETKPKPNILQFPVTRLAAPEAIPAQNPLRVNPEARVRILDLTTVERSAGPDFAKQHILAQRVRATLARFRTAARVQALPAAQAETSTVAQPKTQIISGPATETATQTVVRTAAQTKLKAGKSAMNGIRTRNGAQTVSNNSQQEQGKQRKYKERDLEINAKRLVVLVSSLDNMRAENFEQGVDGSALVRRTLIGAAEAFRSTIFYQRGELNRVDGGQRRIELTLGSIRDVNEGQLKELVEGNTAIKETLEPPAELPTSKEVDNVFNPPNSPVSYSEPVISEEVNKKIGDKPEAIQITDSAPNIQRSQVIEETKINDHENTEPVVEDTVLLAPVLDIEEYISNEALKRRKLILAA